MPHEQLDGIGVTWEEIAAFTAEEFEQWWDLLGAAVRRTQDRREAIRQAEELTGRAKLK